VSVCIYSPSERIWGGGQIYIDNLCRFLNENNVSASIATSEPESFSSPAIRMRSASSKRRRLLSSPFLAKKLRSNGVEVVVLNDLASLWLAPVFRLFGLKVVSLLHLYLQRKNEFGFGHGRMQYHFLRFASRFAHLVYSVSKENQNSFPVPVHWVGNFISPWFFESVRVEEKCYDIGLIARLSIEKNIPLFVELVANLNKFSERPIKALIVGEGDQDTLIRSTIERFGMVDYIELKPWVDRPLLPGIFDQLRCFAVTSHHEGFATTLLEAHARGVPAISTRTAGFCAEFIEDIPPNTGLAFDSSDVESKTFLNEVLMLVDNSALYDKVCRDKAHQFSEELVLGKICSGIETLFRPPMSKIGQ